MLCARSMILTGSPMSRTKTSPLSPIAPGLDDELHGLGDRHEVARHVRVRDGHRPAARDLAAEERDDAAGRAEDVAEADGDEAASPFRRGAAAASTIHSQSAFVWPSTFFGFTALSVETRTKRFDAELGGDARRATRVPRTLLRTDSSGFASMSGTCL